MKKNFVFGLWLIAVLLSTESVFSAWSTNPTVNTPVCTAPYDQRYPQIISDGLGGAIIIWQDYRNGVGNSDIYAQRLDSVGNALWTADGVPVCAATNTQLFHYSDGGGGSIVSDSPGGAIIVWIDVARNGSGTGWDIYAQRLDSSGNPLWTLDGVPICTAFGTQYDPQVISDGSGSAIVVWWDNRSGTDYDIYAQRIDSSGNPLWTLDGVPVSMGNNESGRSGTEPCPHIVSDGQGGAIIVWWDYKRRGTIYTGYMALYAQRLDSSGNALWPINGNRVTVNPIRVPWSYNSMFTLQIVSNGSGGVIIVWNPDSLSTGDNGDIYAQRMDSSGNTLWGDDGVAVCTANGTQGSQGAISDRSGGAIIVWYDWRNYPVLSIYAQRIDSSGNALWTNQGVYVSGGARSRPQLIFDGSGGCIVAWADDRNGVTNTDIYAQRLDASGNALWVSNGVPVCTTTYSQDNPRLVSDGSGGAIIAWEDYRGIIEYDIYAQQIDSFGKLGHPSPPPPTEEARLVVPWYNDSGGNSLLASFITVFNPTPYNVTLTVTYTGAGSVDATPTANTFVLAPKSSKAGRPFQVSGVGEGQEQGPPNSMPNATSAAPFGSATFTAQVPVGSKIYGDTLRTGAIDLDFDGVPEFFSGIAPAVSR